MGASDPRPVILIVDNSIAVTGALKAIINATSHLAEDYRFVFVLPESSSALPFLTELNLKYHTLPFVEISKKFGNLVKYFPYLVLNGYRLLNLIKSYQVKIVHMNDFYNMTGLMAKMLGGNFKLVTHVRFLPDKFFPALSKTWAKLNLQYAEQIICVSKAVQKFFPKSEKVLVIPDPLPEFESHPKKSQLPHREHLVKLLYLSNFIRGKGQDLALQAFRKAYEQNSALRLTFAGGDMGLEKNKEFRDELLSETKKLGLEGVVAFEGFVADVEAKIKSADILLNFSESESFSLTCLDALYFGTPLIASDCGGPAELFENGKSGFLVPNKDVPAMAEAMLKLANDVELRQQFSQAGKLFVQSKFSFANTYLKLKHIYGDLIESIA